MNIRDIANLAGVSASTVSKVMNWKDKDISGVESISRIRKAIMYPRITGRCLRTRRKQS